MPPRLKVLRHNLSLHDLPILPFLAPRVFAPWPTLRPSRDVSNSSAHERHDVRHHDRGVASVRHEDTRRRKYCDVCFEFEGSMSGVQSVAAGIPEGENVRKHSPRTHEHRLSRRKSERLPFARFNSTGLGPPVNHEKNREFLRLDKDTLGLSPTKKTSRIPRVKREGQSWLPKVPRVIPRDTQQRGYSATAAYQGVDRKTDLQVTGNSKAVPKTVEGEIAHSELGINNEISRQAFETRVEAGDTEMVNVIRRVQGGSRNHGLGESNGQDLHTQPKSDLFRKARKVIWSKQAAETAGMPLVRPRWWSVPIDSPENFVDISRDWPPEFAKLSMKYDRDLQEHRKTLQSDPWMQLKPWTPRITELAKNISKLPNASAIKQYWSQQLSLTCDNSQHVKEWTAMMLCVLHRHPNAALKVLLGAYDSLAIPPSAISDSLEYIVSFYLQEDTFPRNMWDPNGIAANATVILRCIKHITSHERGAKVSLTQKTIKLLLPHLKSTHMRRFYDSLLQRGQKLHENTLLLFVHHLAKNGETQKGIEALTLLHNRGADFTKPVVESVCATLLHNRYHRRESKISDSDLFSHMLKMGLQPNIILYNILLLNSIRFGNSTTAWRIHDLMVELNIKPDEYSYSILLHDAKQRLHGPSVSRIFELVQTQKISSPFLITDLLHAMFRMHEENMLRSDRKYSPELVEPPFRKMLTLYEKHFDIEPLNLLLRNRMDPIGLETGTKKPPVPTLIVMLIAFLRGYRVPALEFYKRFRQLAIQGHPAILPLTKSTHIYDAVIKALGSHPETLAYCPKVIADMLSSRSNPTILNAAPSDFETPSHSSQPESVQQCTPNIRTWSILLKAFMDHNQHFAAEKVTELMTARGIKPNIVTWNSLAAGYGRAQDIPNLVRVIKRLEADQLVPDDFTMNALEKINNRKGLAKALDDLRLRKKRITNSDTLRELEVAYNLQIPGATTSDVPVVNEPVQEMKETAQSVSEHNVPGIIDPESLGLSVTDDIVAKDSEDASVAV